MNEGNLKPFKPGESGNPNGRPKGPHSRTVALELLEQETPQAVFEKFEALYGVKLTEKTKLKALMQSAMLRGILGDNSAMKEFLDRTEGKVAQPITGADGEAIKIEYTALPESFKE